MLNSLCFSSYESIKDPLHYNSIVTQWWPIYPTTDATPLCHFMMFLFGFLGIQHIPRYFSKNYFGTLFSFMYVVCVSVVLECILSRDGLCILNILESRWDCTKMPMNCKLRNLNCQITNTYHNAFNMFYLKNITFYHRMGRYSAEILRACRLVVDTGLHYYK